MAAWGKGKGKAKGAPARPVLPRPAGRAPVAVAPRAAPSSGPPPITVSGCQNVTIANIIKGSYTASGSNHNKPIYQKEGSYGSVAVLIYYWDERDGPNFHGWWFGPKVGGDQVWAYSANKASQLPPTNGWKVPWDGQVDATVQLQHGGAIPAQVGARAFGAVGGQPRPGLRPVSKQLEEVKKREEESKKRVQELKQKRDQEEAQRKESAAALAVRKAIQRVRSATPGTYDELRANLEETQAKNLEAMGTQAEKVSEEATTALEEAQKRIDELHAKRLQEEQKKQEQERLKKEMEEKVAQFVQLSKDEATAMLEKVKETEELVAKLQSPSEVKELEEGQKQLDETKEGAKSLRLKIMANQKDVADAESFRKVKREVMELTTKLAAATRSLERSGAQLQQAAQRMQLKQAALEKLEERNKEFTSFDKDKDGKLNLTEMKNYCQSKGLDLAQEILDRIMSSLGTITVDQFRPMHRKLFVAHWEAIARKKAEEEQEKLRKIEEEKQACQAILDSISELLSSCEATAKEAEGRAKPLIKDDTQKGSEEINAEADEVLKSVEEAETKLQGSGEKLPDAKAALEALVDGQMSTSLKKLETREVRARGQLAKITAAIKLAREKAKRKAYAEFDQKRTDCANAIRAQMTSKEKSADELFEEINSGEALDRVKFQNFLKELPGLEWALEDQIVSKLFDNLATEGSISREGFKDLVRVFYKCVKATVMSSEISIKSKTIRRLEVGEVLEALAVPSLEDVTRVMRVQCIATEDELSGWVTVAGNQGTTFLEPGGNFYTCVKETVLSDSLELQDSKTLRRIGKGEVIEVIEFPKKDATADVRRIKGKAKLDGAVGWISLASNQGTVFLEPC